MAEKKKEEIAENEVKKTKKKSNAKLWIIGILIALLAFAGFKFYSFRQDTNKRFEVAQQQRDIMIDSWREQGLSDEEIEERLENFRKDRSSGDRPPGAGIFRLFRGGRGPGR